MNKTAALLLLALIIVIGAATAVGGFAVYQKERQLIEQRQAQRESDEREKHYKRVDEMLYDGSSQAEMDAYIKANLPGLDSYLKEHLPGGVSHLPQ